MDLKVAHDFIDFMLNKERGIFLSPPEKDVLLHRAQMWLYTEEFDVYGKTQKLQDSLGVFSTKFTYTSTSGGLVVLPTDETVNPCYQHLLSIWAQYYDNTLAKTRYKDELAERLNSQILEPLVTDPVGLELNPGNFQLYPATTISGYGFYLKKPVAPVFSYTLGGDRRTITYNAGASTQLEWNDSSMNKILMKAIQLAAENQDNKGAIEFTELKNSQTI
jgi:hypothetical protein